MKREIEITKMEIDHLEEIKEEYYEDDFEVESISEKDLK